MQIRGLLIGFHTGGRKGRGNVCMIAERLDNGQDGCVLEERQFARAEVVKQRPERLWADSNLRVQPPGR